MFSEWLNPPALRSGEDDLDRHAMWLELFFDLVFVVAVAGLVHTFADQFTKIGAIEFVVFFTPVWWAWVGSMFYATRFDTDDLEYCIFTVVEMFAVVALAVNISAGLGETSQGLAPSYAAVRGVLVVKYVRALRSTGNRLYPP